MTAGRRTLALALAALLATALLSLAGSAQQAAQNPRIALVIGNATYRDVALATTANDAGLIAQTLQAAGFDVVGARGGSRRSVPADRRSAMPHDKGVGGRSGHAGVCLSRRPRRAI